MNLEARERLFHEALALPSPQERAAFLQGACGGDSALRDEVLALLEAHDRTVPFPATETGEAGPGETLVEGPGTVIGRYKLLQQIGEGGMGVVYMAEQTEPVTRKVALKIIKLGMDTRQVVARFEAERQALALMDHPNIAKVLDAGSTSTGRPYFVMELVRGIPITQYCDQHHLSARQRLELFIPVCHAIQHAHQKGILHRDIKPSNVLVALHDGRPLPMVIDFGIAKATHQRLTEKTLFTQFGNIIGTPAYMSPEQAEMNQLDVDTRTDIYSLGVLLYELLTGTTPFSAKELLDAGYAGMQRMIAEREPPRPSTRLSTMLEAQRTTVARNRRMEPSALTRLFQGDLDWVVMRCLEKERARRYESASGLAADLERHLHSEPVTARPPTAAYRFQKALRRNRAAFVAGAVVALALIAGISLSSWQAILATRARTEALDAKARETTQRLDAQRARDEAQAAQAVALEARNAEQGLRVQAERDLYASRLNLAQQAWARNNGGQLRRILETTRNSPHRGFEWAYWEKHARGTQRVLRGHPGGMVAVAWSPDGHRIATAGSEDGMLKLWDARTGRELATTVAEGNEFGGVVTVTFSPDGRHLATAGWSSVKLFDPTRATPIRTFFSENEFQVVFSPDGSRMFTSSGNVPLRLWDLGTGTIEKTFESEDRDNGAAIAVSRDFRTLASAHGDGSLRIWNLPDGTERFRRKIRDGFLQSLDVSPTAHRVAVAGADAAEIWDTQTGERLLRLGTGLFGIYAVAFSPDGTRLATGTQEGAILIWNTSTGERTGVLRGTGDGINALAFSPDGFGLVAGNYDGTAEIWDVPRTETVENPPDLVPGSTLSPGYMDPGQISFSSDGRRLLAAGFTNVQIWETSSGRALSTPSFKYRWRLQLSKEGNRMVWIDQEQQVHVVEIAGDRELSVLPLPGSPCRAAISADGSRIVSVTSDGVWKVWDAATGREQGSHTNAHLAGFTYGLQLAFSPDARCIAACRAEDTDASVVVCLDVETGAELFALESEHQVFATATFSPDGQRLAVASGPRSTGGSHQGDQPQVRIFDASAGRELLALRGHQQAVASIDFSPDGRRILTGGGDDILRVWDALGGAELLALRVHGGGICSVAFSPDHHRIACSAYDGVIRVWETATQDELKAWEAADTDALTIRKQLADELAARRAAARRASLTQWQVLGPIPVPTNLTAQAVLELKALPDDPSPVPFTATPAPASDGGLSWRTAVVKLPILRSREIGLPTLPGSLSYGKCLLRCTTLTTGVVLHVGSMDAVKVLLNGAEVMFINQHPAPGRGPETPSPGLTLLPGTNTLTFKITSPKGAWGASLRLSDAENNPLQGVEVIPPPDAPPGGPPRAH